MRLVTVAIVMINAGSSGNVVATVQSVCAIPAIVRFVALRVVRRRQILSADTFNEIHNQVVALMAVVRIGTRHIAHTVIRVVASSRRPTTDHVRTAIEALCGAVTRCNFNATGEFDIVAHRVMTTHCVRWFITHKVGSDHRYKQRHQHAPAQTLKYPPQQAKYIASVASSVNPTNIANLTRHPLTPLQLATQGR
jgi:hypothetical protein